MSAMSSLGAALPMRYRETSCFVEFIDLARIAASYRNSCFLLLRSSMNVEAS